MKLIYLEDLERFAKSISKKVKALIAVQQSEANSAVSNHNTSVSAHNDIRNLVAELTARLNALADSDDTTLDQLSEIVDYIKSNKSLIDSITTSKVSVSNIIDNLISEYTDKPLSANQGKVLHDLIVALTADVGNKVDKVSGNAPSATKLATARNIALSGDVTGSVAFDGTADKTISAILANSGVTEGTYGPLELVTKNNGTVWVSNNTGLHGTSAVSTWTAKQACKISFKWKVSSESASYDYLNITAAGTQILANTGGETEQTGTLTVALQANQKIVFTYRKDGSQSKGADRAEISEIKYGAGTADPSTVIYENNVKSYFTITNSEYGFYPGTPIPNVTVDAKGRITKEQTVYIPNVKESVATTSSDGLLSAADKLKLDTLAGGNDISEITDADIDKIIDGTYTE